MKKETVVYCKRIGDKCLAEVVEFIDKENGFFEALKDTTFLLPQLEILVRPEVKRFAASNME